MDVDNKAKLYTKDKKVGEGTYAIVYLGRQLSTNRKVAIKKIKIGQLKEGLDISAIREVKFLREIKHENIIELIDVFSSKKNLNLILEFLISDLEIIIKDKSLVFSSSDIKSWLLMTLRGLHYLHSYFILHRDLKPNNLLIDANGVLKIADFGLARDFGNPYVNMTSQVVTRWYRSPELLFGAKSYGTGVDIWSIGCIFAELMLRTPYLPGNTDVDQLDTIFRALGTPTDEDWPGMRQLPDFVEFKQYPKPAHQRDLFTAASEEELHLLEWLLLFDPLKRPSAKQALKSKYFSTLPRPTHPSQLPKRKIIERNETNLNFKWEHENIKDVEFDTKPIAQKNSLEIRIYDQKSAKNAAIIAHPYAPLGGNFNNHVVVAIAVITFNFRGALGSKGRTSWSSYPEQQDFQTVINYTLTNFPKINRIILGGYSYGSLVAIKMKPPIKNAFFLLISPLLPPLTYFLGLSLQFTSNDLDKKGLVIYGGKDLVASLFSWRNYSKFWANLNDPNRLITVKVENTGHFWNERNNLEILLSEISNWIKLIETYC
ncbi:hypothetical protein PMAC_000272 [Pneumocystis sp. 'macacae']|nr:hypothetical protein PMAC_000272 [Pneumocystis sp. 'macacae']